MSSTRPERDMSFSSNDWVILKRWANEQMESLKDRICGVNSPATPDETNVLRGRIATLKTILEFEKLAAKERLANHQTE